MGPLLLVWNPTERRPRAPWRALTQAALSLGLFLLVVRLVADPISASYKSGAAFAGVSQTAFDRIINMIAGPLLTMAVLSSVLVVSRFLDRRPITDLGILRTRKTIPDLVFGFLLGGLLMTLIFLAEVGAGWWNPGPYLVSLVAGVSLPLSFAFTLVKVVCVGITEESVSRGYLIPNLAEALGFTRWSRSALLAVAAVISSFVFAAIHGTNPNFTAAAFVGLWLNGLMLATAFLLTGSLALPIALHASWNLFQGAVYGFPVSGDREGASVVTASQHGPLLMTGGSFGPEAGIVSFVAVLLGIVAIGIYSRARNGSLRPEASPRWLRSDGTGGMNVGGGADPPPVR